MMKPVQIPEHVSLNRLAIASPKPDPEGHRAMNETVWHQEPGFRAFIRPRSVNRKDFLSAIGGANPEWRHFE
jgi:hypothetical protein